VNLLFLNRELKNISVLSKRGMIILGDQEWRLHCCLINMCHFPHLETAKAIYLFMLIKKTKQGLYYRYMEMSQCDSLYIYELPISYTNKNEEQEGKTGSV
jgi:hypothetical protein